VDAVAIEGCGPHFFLVLREALLVFHKPLPSVYPYLTKISTEMGEFIFVAPPIFLSKERGFEVQRGLRPSPFHLPEIKKFPSDGSPAPILRSRCLRGARA
jgi:hypothetical protein